MNIKSPALFRYLECQPISKDYKIVLSNYLKYLLRKENKNIPDQILASNKTYPYINIRVNFNSIFILILHSNCHLEYWVLYIRGLLWCQEYRHQGKRELVVQLQITKYEFEPVKIVTQINFLKYAWITLQKMR